MNKVKKFTLYFFILILIVSCGTESSVKKVELSRNIKYNLITLSTVDDLVAALILESGELGSIKEIKNKMEWSKQFSDNTTEIFLVKYKNSKVTVPVMKLEKNIFIDIDSIECVGMNVMGENKIVKPVDIGY